MARAEFGKIQKKIEIGEWLTIMTLGVYRPTPKEEGRQKSYGNGIRSLIGNRGGERDTIYNIGVDPQLLIMERFGVLLMMARS